MIKAFKYGINIGISQWRIALIAYFFQLFLAVILGLQIYQVIEASIGSSLEINKLIEGYDDTVVSDFLNVHGASLSPLLGQLRYVFLVYLLFSVFINAGLLFAVVENKTGWEMFWKGGATYFFRFFILSLLFLFIAGLWAAIIWVPFMGFFPTSPEVFASEKTSVFLLFGFLFIFFIGLVFLFNWSVVSRIKIINEEKKNWQAIKEGFGFAIRRFFSLNGIFLLFLLFQLLFIIIYWQIEAVSGMVSPILILIFLIIQQVLVFGKWMFKIGTYAGVDNYYKNKLATH